MRTQPRTQATEGPGELSKRIQALAELDKVIPTLTMAHPVNGDPEKRLTDYSDFNRTSFRLH